MNKSLEVPVEVTDQERIIEVTDYTYRAGCKAVTNRAPEDCYPAEPEELDDIQCHWADTGADLTDAEFELYQEQIEEACFEQVRADSTPDYDYDPL